MYYYMLFELPFDTVELVRRYPKLIDCDASFLIRK